MLDRSHPGGNPQELLLRALSNDLGGLPAIFWRVNLVKNEITFLNDHSIPGLGDDTTRLLQDETSASKLLAVEDRPVFQRYRERLRQRKSVSEVFRVYGRDGLVHWLCIVGTPDPELSFGYLGVIADCTGLANRILHGGSQTSLADHLELFDTPVFMVHVASKSVAAANKAAQAALGLPAPGAGGFPLDEVFAPVSRSYLSEIYEQLLFSREWKGQLTLRSATGEELLCKTRIRAYERDGCNLLWFSLLTPASQNGRSEKRPKLPASIVRAMKNSQGVRGLLNTLLELLPPERGVDAVMLSQIFISEGRIAVTGVGKPFETVSVNDEHPYRGSIAENMVLFDLDHVIVKDTSKSIKPIDWALFIPRGIVSYCALPYFEGGVLRDVLIFCATRPEMFGDEELSMYRGLALGFWDELPRILLEDTREKVDS